MRRVTRGPETMRRLYEGLDARDADAVASCYAPVATFEDPVFRLEGGDVTDMWRMLIERGRDLRVEHEIVDATSARWTARYTFGGHPVTNRITSRFAFNDEGRILQQLDSFDFPRWAAQALGLKGRLFGRFRFLRSAVRRASATSLASWQRRRGRDGQASSGSQVT